MGAAWPARLTLAGRVVVLEDARGVTRLDRSDEETLAPPGSRVLWHDEHAERFLVREAGALVRVTRGRDRTTVADIPIDAALAASSDGERIAIGHGDRVQVVVRRS